MDGLASCEGEPAGQRNLNDFLAEHGHQLGRSYASELNRNYLGGTEPVSPSPALRH
ncbi:MAG: hypothetical protein R2789_16405 [Microthrixaceae bacterium]